MFACEKTLTKLFVTEATRALNGFQHSLFSVFEPGSFVNHSFTSYNPTIHSHPGHDFLHSQPIWAHYRFQETDCLAVCRKKQ